jgi:plastocyanin
MKENFYHAGFLATVLLVFVASGPVISATTDTTQSPETTNATTQTSQEATVRVAIGEGSNATIQHYTFTPQRVEINAGDNVTWVTPAALSDIHTVTFVLDPNVMSDIILPFAVSGDTNFELVPPFNLGEPVMIQAPDGREAIVAINKHAWYPAVTDANNQTTYLNGTDIRYTMDGTEKVINSGIILPPMESTGGAVDQNSSSTATGGEETTPGTGVVNETTTSTGNTTAQETQGGAEQPPIGPPFPPVSSFTVTFEEPGTYPYFCAIHPWMAGEVIVREAGGNQTATGGGGASNQTSIGGGNETGTQEENGAGALASLFE